MRSPITGSNGGKRLTPCGKSLPSVITVNVTAIFAERQVMRVESPVTLPDAQARDRREIDPAIVEKLGENG